MKIIDNNSSVCLVSEFYFLTFVVSLFSIKNKNWAHREKEEEEEDEDGWRQRNRQTIVYFTCIKRTRGINLMWCKFFEFKIEIGMERTDNKNIKICASTHKIDKIHTEHRTNVNGIVFLQQFFLFCFCSLSVHFDLVHFHLFVALNVLFFFCFSFFARAYKLML